MSGRHQLVLVLIGLTYVAYGAFQGFSRMAARAVDAAARALKLALTLLVLAFVVTYFGTMMPATSGQSVESTK
jgi:uncharacterized membrane protein (DUF485 family)